MGNNANVNTIETVTASIEKVNGNKSNISTGSFSLDIEEISLPKGVNFKGIHLGATVTETDEGTKVATEGATKLFNLILNSNIFQAAIDRAQKRDEIYAEEAKVRTEAMKAREKREQERHALEMKELEARISEARFNKAEKQSK